MSQYSEMNQAIAELAYAIAKIDGELHKREKKAFLKIIGEELGADLDEARVRFDLLDQITKPKMEEAYQDAIEIIRYNKLQLNDHLKGRFVRVLEQVAESNNGIEASENVLIKKFKQDIKDL